MKIKKSVTKNNAFTCLYKSVLGNGGGSQVSTKELFDMQLHLSLCCCSRVTRMKSLSLHLNTFNQIKNRFKTRLHD